MKKILFAITITIALTACNNTNNRNGHDKPNHHKLPTQHNSLEYQHLKGKVKSIKESVSYDCYLKNNEWHAQNGMRSSYFLFNDSGYIVEANYYYDNKLQSRHIYEYGVLGRGTSKQSIFYADTLNSVVHTHIKDGYTFLDTTFILKNGKPEIEATTTTKLQENGIEEYITQNYLKGKPVNVEKTSSKSKDINDTTFFSMQHPDGSISEAKIVILEKDKYGNPTKTIRIRPGDNKPSLHLKTYEYYQ